MPPPVKHDDCAIIFDKNVSPDFFPKAQQCLLDIYGYKWCRTSKDNVCLLPFGEKIPNNTEFSTFCPSDAKNAIGDGPETNDCHIIKALLRAVKLLEKQFYNTKGLINLQLVCISDFSNSKFDIAAQEELVEKINDLKIFLYIIGPDVHLSETLMNWRDVHAWLRQPVFECEVTENLKSLKQLLECVNRSVVCGLQFGLTLFNYYKKHPGPQPIIIPLMAGSRMTFTNRDVRMLKKLSYLKYESNNEYKYVLADNPEIQIDFRDTVRGLHVCDKMIVMPADVREYCRSKGERCFELLGCAERNEIPNYYFIGDGTHKIFPSGLYAEWTFGLCKILKEKDMVGIVAKRVIKNTKPKIWALIPSDDGRWFYMVQMPYGNKIKKRYYEKKVEDFLDISADGEQEKAIYDFLDGMELTVAELPLNVTMTNNPHFKKYWRFMTQKCVGVEEPKVEEEEVLGKTGPLQHTINQFWPERDLYEL